MKVELIEITAEMVGNHKELAKALMKNFNAINNMAEKREKLIIARLDKMQTQITVIKNRLTGVENGLKVLGNSLVDVQDDLVDRIERTDEKIDAILKHFKIKVGKKIIKANSKH